MKFNVTQQKEKKTKLLTCSSQAQGDYKRMSFCPSLQQLKASS